MKNHQTLPLITLALLLLASLLASSAAGSARASGLRLEISAAWEYYGEEQGVQLGYAVAGAGDVNGDGKADILVGAANGGSEKEGQVLLFLGSPAGPSDLPDWQALGEHKGDDLGIALDGAGDVNGDGFADIVAGASHYTVSSELAGEGAAYVYHGSAVGLGASWSWKVEGEQKDATLGRAVAGAGDINADGFADVIVGVPGYTNGDLSNAGAAYVYFGSASGLSATSGWQAVGEQASAQLGLQVEAAGDVNDDGYADVLVAAPYFNRVADFTYLNAGAVTLYLGSALGLADAPAWSYLGYRAEDRLGTSAAGVGDLDGDGCDDIAIGAPGYDLPGIVDAGRVYVFYGCQAESGSPLNDAPDWTYSYPLAYTSTGSDVSSAGDTNADGYAELLVGAHLFDDEQANEGAAFAFFGGPSGLPAEPGWQAEGNKNDTDFGFAVDGAGDTNGDGFTDVLIGSPAFRIEEIIKGASFLYFGSQSVRNYQIHLPFIRK